MSTRRSVPTKGISRYWASNWSYVMPDFDKPNHSIVEWNGAGEPQDPEPSNDNNPDELLREIADIMGEKA